MSLNHKIDILNKLDIFGAINLNHKKELWQDINARAGMKDTATTGCRRIERI